MAFFIGLFLLCASTLMYEVVLTRLLSVICWYYLAFVSVSMAMFGMTAGALAVQLRPEFFHRDEVPRRIAQAAFAMAVSMPLSLMTILAVPVDVSAAAQTLYSFLLLSTIIAVPFFFAGIAVCLSLTKVPFPLGRIYFVDLLGASAGCFLAAALLKIVDGPSAIFLIAMFLFLSAALYSRYANDLKLAKRSALYAMVVLVLGVLNAATLHGIQPIWVKGKLDKRNNILAEKWNPISKVRASKIVLKQPQMWGPSPRTPKIEVEELSLNIDNDAQTPLTHYEKDLSKFAYLRYDVTSLAAQLRPGGTAAIIGVGGGRDALNCALNGYRRIVGIEVNSAMLEMTTRRFAWFSGLSKVPGLELHNDEGRSYLTRSGERFDLIQASLVDTWAATAAGAMTLSENALYTVDGWRVFFEHLTPGGLITFSRWYRPGFNTNETYRLFSVAWAMLLSEGVTHPANHLALIRSGDIATLIVSNLQLSSIDLARIREIANDMEFEVLYLPHEPLIIAQLTPIMAAHGVSDLMTLKDQGYIDYSPTFDNSPYFFNAVHVANIPRLLLQGRGHGPNLRAILFVFAFLWAAIILVLVTILLPARRLAWVNSGDARVPTGGIIYFIAIGVGFMLVEMAMIQQLSIFLGHPIYSLVVVLGCLILSSGLGSLVSDRLNIHSALQQRAPAFAVTLAVAAYAVVVIPVMHFFTAGVLWERVLVSLALIVPCGLLMGSCFPVGMRSLSARNLEKQLPWMWALNGAAGTLGTFLAVVVSMDTTITICVISGAACYFIAGVAIPTAVPSSSPERNLGGTLTAARVGATTGSNQ